MGLESGTYIGDLVATNPVGATDQRSTADDHLRLLKATLQATFPGMVGAFARAQDKGGTYTVVVNDNTSLIRATTAITLNLTAAATLGNKHWFAVEASGGNVTVDPNLTEQINGATTLVVPQGTIALIWCNGTAFFALLAPKALSASALALLSAGTVKDNFFTIQDDADMTKQLQFQLSGITTSTTRTLTAPNASGTIALTTDLSAQTGVWCGTAGGTADALTLTPSPAITAYAAGQLFIFKSGAAPNTGATTVAVSGLAAQAVQFQGAVLTAAQIKANRWYEVLYDGAAFQLGEYSTDAVEDVTTTQGDLLVRGASVVERLAAGSTSGHVLTSNGAGAKPSYQAVPSASFPSGTAMLFQQTSAPTGWTKQTTHNDKTLRVVSGTASSGGSVAFSTVFGKTATDAHTLTEAQMPSHVHREYATDGFSTVIPLNTKLTHAGAPPINSLLSDSVADASTYAALNTGSTGSGSSHSHNIDIRVQYVDLIIATKD